VERHPPELVAVGKRLHALDHRLELLGLDDLDLMLFPHDHAPDNTADQAKGCIVRWGSGTTLSGRCPGNGQSTERRRCGHRVYRYQLCVDMHRRY
jgi:hypothetical protein